MPCKIFCKRLDPFLTNPRITGLVIIAASVGLLGGAYFFQYVIGLEPCILCLYQRAPHAVAFALGLLVLGVFKKAKPAALIVLLCAFVYLVSAGLGLYHAGVEQHWWVSALEACSAPGISTGSSDLLSQIENAKAARCDAIPWQLFGISMAGYNALLSFGLMIYCAVAALLITRRANGF
ncbi:MAG: disulfide bond formation protein B [Micavibrio sp.]